MGTFIFKKTKLHKKNKRGKSKLHSMIFHFLLKNTLIYGLPLVAIVLP